MVGIVVTLSQNMPDIRAAELDNITITDLAGWWCVPAPSSSSSCKPIRLTQFLRLSLVIVVDKSNMAEERFQRLSYIYSTKFPDAADTSVHS